MSLTDNEIIKALECCYGDIEEGCDNCPNRATCADINVVESVINLINRQKASIKGLNDLVGLAIDTQNEFSNKIHEQEAEIERLLQKMQQLQAEAIKEFAERLENGPLGYYDWEAKQVVYTETDIDNLVKEMVGDE